MKGLIIKDLLTLENQRIFYLVFIALIALVFNVSALIVVMMAAGIPRMALAFDEQCKWDLLAGALPYTVLQLVLSKYVLGLMATLSTVLLAIAVWLAKMLLNVAQQSFIELMVYIAAGLVVNLLLQGISLPLILRVGAERGCLLGLSAVTLALLVLLIIAAAGAYNGPEVIVIISALAFIAVAVHLVSIPLSLRAYRRRYRT